MTVDANGVRELWVGRLREFLPGWFAEHEVLSRLSDGAAVVLYGSTARGLDDAWSDLDLGLLLSDSEFQALAGSCDTTFFGFGVEGKEGHIMAVPVRQWRDEVAHCHMDRIYHLQRAAIVSDVEGRAAELLDYARAPMREEVRRAMFLYHYVEMRSDHRACDNPMERREPPALLFSLPKVLGHGLRAAMILDGEPYPYDKWLYQAAQATPSGRALTPHVDRVIELLGGDALRFDGPASDNPIDHEVHAIRNALMEAARAAGIDEPWLDTWWLSMDAARVAHEEVRW